MSSEARRSFRRAVHDEMLSSTSMAADEIVGADVSGAVLKFMFMSSLLDLYVIRGA
jgi:hypothetical protein